MNLVEARRSVAREAARIDRLGGGEGEDAAIAYATTVVMSPELVRSFHRMWAAEPLRDEADRYSKQTIRAVCAAIGIEVRDE